MGGEKGKKKGKERLHKARDHRGGERKGKKKERSLMLRIKFKPSS